MFPTIRRIALALAGAAALIAAGRARADHLDRPPGLTPAVPQVQPWDYPAPQGETPPVYQAPAYPAPAYQVPAPVLRFTLALPAPPAWLAIAPPPPPAYGVWTRVELEREYRWLDAARARFHQYVAWNPWRVRQLERWYQVRHAELDRRWTALASAPVPRHGWRGPGWDRREDWEHGRWGHQRWDRDDD